SERIHHERGVRHGRLDQRRLSKATSSENIFRRTHVTKATGRAICLLMDESGSMARGSPSRATIALRTSVLIAEALRAVPGIQLEISSYASCGEAERDCLVRYLYGAKNRDRYSLGQYGAGNNNYDHQAILTAAKLFEENTRQTNRCMIVLSDGAPNGFLYQGA